jgi:EmrB/QacA subfamily drug resistance transporter
MLVQVALVIFGLGSLAAGFAQSMETLIAARVVQGLGVGGLTALVQVVIAKMVSPRERGRYAGYIGAVFALATVSGPLIGGVLVDVLNWRWCFYFGVPLSILAFVVLQRRLHLEFVPRQVKVDYVGSLLIMAGVSTLLIWVSLGGSQFDWASLTSFALLGAAALLVVLAVLWEGFAATEPVIPLRLFLDRTTTLATLASVLIGIAMFGSTVYLSQYFQMAKGMSPTEAGLMSIFMVGGLFFTSLASGRLVTRTGRWKHFLIIGMLLVVAGLALLGTIDATTSLLRTGLSMTVLGLGLGLTMQNLVLAVQNNTANADMGAASSLVSFFRSIGGSAGVAALGALLSHHVSTDIPHSIAALPPEQQAKAAEVLGGGTLPDVASLPDFLVPVIEHAFGSAIGQIFMVGVPFAVAALVCVMFIKEVPLRTTVLSAEEIEAHAAATEAE